MMDEDFFDEDDFDEEYELEVAEQLQAARKKAEEARRKSTLEAFEEEASTEIESARKYTDEMVRNKMLEAVGKLHKQERERLEAGDCDEMWRRAAARKRELQKYAMRLRYGEHWGGIAMRNADWFLAAIKRSGSGISESFGPYSIRLGREIEYNWPAFFAQEGGDTYIPLRRITPHGRRYAMPFSCQRDAHNSLQSDHVFLSGSTGQGKTNCCSLFFRDFHNRPNPSVGLWISQKSSTAYTDWPRLRDIMEERGRKVHILNLGEEPCEEGRVPVDALTLQDIEEWLEMTPGQFNFFKGCYSVAKSQGGGLTQALQDFMETPTGNKFRDVYQGAVDGGIFAFKKSDALIPKSKHSYCLNISTLLDSESPGFADIVTTAFINYFSRHVANQRKLSMPQLKMPDGFKQQWQCLVAFDEYREIATNASLARTVATTTRLSTQGRQQGTSLLLASQTVYYGGSGEKVALTQAGSVVQFKPSSASDKEFCIRSQGWEKDMYSQLVDEAFNQVFPPSAKSAEAHKGKVIVFTKGGLPVCVQLDLMDVPQERVEEEETDDE